MVSPELKALKNIFDAHRQEWLARGLEGRYAVVCPDGFIGFAEDLLDAHHMGKPHANGGKFLVQPIAAHDERFRLNRVVL